MIGWLLSHWLVAAALALGWVGGKLRQPRRRRPVAPSRVWAPEIVPAWKAHDYSGTYKSDDTVAVRILKPASKTAKEQVLTIGSVPVAADDFEEQLAALSRAAEDRAAALNAAELEAAA